MANNELSVMLTAKGNLESELKNARTRVKELGDEIKQAQASGSGVGEDLAAEYRKASIAAKNLSDDLNKVNKDVKKTATESTSAAAKVGRAWQKAASVFNNDLVAGLSAAALIAFGKKSVDTFSTVQDASSALSATFGANGDALIKWAQDSGDALNLSQTEALSAAQTFAIFAESAGLAGTSLQTFTTDLTTRAADLASFYGGSTAQAVEALSSGLAGQSEVLRKYGIFVDDASLKQKAMELGIYSGSGALSAQQKIMATQAIVMRDSARAAGDVARTQDSMANQIKDSQQQMSDFQATVGETIAIGLAPLMNILNTAMQMFSGLPGPVKQVAIAIGLVSVAALIATPRIVAMMAAMKTAGVTATGMGTKLKSMIASAFNPWTLALTAATIGITMWIENQNRARDAAKGFSEALDTQTGALAATTYERIGQRLGELITSGEEWNRITQATGKTQKDFVDAVAKGGKPLDDLINQLNELGDYGNLVSMFSNDKRLYNAASRSINQVNEELRDGKDVWAATSKLSDAAGNAIEGVGTTAKTTADRVKDLVDAVSSLGKSVSLARAVRGFRKTIKDYIKKPSTDAALAMVSDFDSAFGNFEEGSKAQAQFAKDNYARMAAAIKKSGIDKEIKTGILDNLAATKTKADEVLAGLKTLDGQKVTVDIVPRGALPSTETPVRRAMGGAVWGAGTATSDSIPALLSNGEYVIRANAAKSIGYGNLDKLNQGKMSDPALLSHLTLQAKAEVAAASVPMIGQIVVNNPAHDVDVEKAVTRGMARAQRIQRERAASNG